MMTTAATSPQIRQRIGDLHDETLSLADQLNGSAVAALIAQALHVVDDTCPIALPPGYAATP